MTNQELKSNEFIPTDLVTLDAELKAQGYRYLWERNLDELSSGEEVVDPNKSVREIIREGELRLKTDIALANWRLNRVDYKPVVINV